MQKSIEKILVDIITHELDLPQSYGKTARGDLIPCVIAFSQNIKLFNTDRLQITVRTVSAQDYSNRSEVMDNPNSVKEDGSDAFIEVQDINQNRMMQVDIYSRNNEARERFWEVSTALNSNYAQQMQDLYNFKLSTITNAVNISGIDGGSDINRYTISFNAFVHYQKTRIIDYYDKFQTDIHTEQGLTEQIIIGE